MSSSTDPRRFETLTAYLSRIPSVKGTIHTANNEDGNWSVQFSLDIDHPQAWNTVQELSSVLNYLSIHERLPTLFKPISPPPYLNGGAREFLSWIIESTDPEFKPGTCMKWLEGRLPNPVDDLEQWGFEEDLDN